jgi:hypothetical protein
LGPEEVQLVRLTVGGLFALLGFARCWGQVAEALEGEVVFAGFEVAFLVEVRRKATNVSLMSFKPILRGLILNPVCYTLGRA